MPEPRLRQVHLNPNPFLGVVLHAIGVGHVADKFEKLGSLLSFEVKRV